LARRGFVASHFLWTRVNSPMLDSNLIARRLRQLRRMPLLSPRLWLRRIVFWAGAVLVALVATLFAKAADAAGQVAVTVATATPLAMLVIAPAAFSIAVLLTIKVF